MTKKQYPWEPLIGFIYEPYIDAEPLIQKREVSRALKTIYDDQEAKMQMLEERLTRLEQRMERQEQAPHFKPGPFCCVKVRQDGSCPDHQ